MNRLYKALIVILLSAFFPAGCASSNQGTFMEEHHLSLSPQGAFSFHTKAIDRDGNDVDFVENVTVAINETLCAERKGYKIVEAVFEADLSDLPEGTRIASWQIAFDKYTGTAFEYYRSASDEQPSEFEFDCRGDKVSVQMSYEIQRDTQKKSLTVIIRVICSEGYDGTVFQMGYSDSAINDANMNWPYSKRLYTLDELPGFDTNGHEYYYFSYGQ